MNEAMIQEWNNLVCPEDTVYMLGDVAFLSAEKTTAIIRRLNGRKILVEGNHDHKLVKDPDFCACFEEIHKYLEIVYNKNKIVLSHYPFLEWNGMHRGSLHLSWWAVGCRTLPLPRRRHGRNWHNPNQVR
jgi:calcineurin-like phosphoesterase family protein